MPPGFPLQILDHDAGEHDHLCVYVVKNLAVGEIQAVRDIGGDPRLGGRMISSGSQFGRKTVAWKTIPKSLCAARELIVPVLLCL